MKLLNHNNGGNRNRGLFCYRYFKWVLWFSLSFYFFASFLFNHKPNTISKTTVPQYSKASRALIEYPETQHHRDSLNGLKIYVYDLPSKYNTDWLSNERCSNHLFASEVAIHKALLNSDVRTLNPGFVQQSSAIKKSGQQHSKLTLGGSTSVPASTKKLTRNESISNRTASQRSQAPKGRSIQVEPTSKAPSESSDAIRSKMRESLASALAMACQNPAAKDLSEAVGSQPSQLDVTTTTANEGLPQSSVSHVPQNSGDVLPSIGPFPVDTSNDGHSLSLGLHDDVSMGSTVPCSTEFELHVDDVPFSDNFFVKDELLQGNGLTWAMDLDMHLRETDFLQDAEKANLFDEDVVEDKGEHAKSSPEDLALHIEAELFKLFGGVNKKYKERGRSLLFNLKDRSNPELRERVMSGEIPPDKLCSMTAEELASKELSEWRVAKAEELAQMVVLPDNAIDMRRLVKKTHKGEYQVDFERDDNNIASEISAGSNVTQFMPKKDRGRNSGPSGKDELGSKENLTSQRNNSEKQDVKDSLVIPADGADLLQGMVVEEFKNVELLPPIVSLSEFMESLDSEPPFENLPVENNHSALLPEKGSSEDPNNAVGSSLAAKYPVVASEDKSLGTDGCLLVYSG